MQEGIVNIIIALVAIFGGIGTLLFGKIGDIWFQKDRRGKVILALFCNTFPMVFMIGMLLTNYWVPDNSSLNEILQIPGVIVVTLMISLGMFINQGVGPNWMSSVVEVNLPEHRATMIALANFADLLGNALGPLIGSYISTFFSIQTAMWSMLIFWALNVLLWIPVLTNIRADLATMHERLEERAKLI